MPLAPVIHLDARVPRKGPDSLFLIIKLGEHMSAVNCNAVLCQQGAVEKGQGPISCWWETISS